MERVKYNREIRAMLEHGHQESTARNWQDMAEAMDMAAKQHIPKGVRTKNMDTSAHGQTIRRTREKRRGRDRIIMQTFKIRGDKKQKEGQNVRHVRTHEDANTNARCLANIKNNESGIQAADQK